MKKGKKTNIKDKIRKKNYESRLRTCAETKCFECYKMFRMFGKEKCYLKIQVRRGAQYVAVF